MKSIECACYKTIKFGFNQNDFTKDKTSGYINEMKSLGIVEYNQIGYSLIKHIDMFDSDFKKLFYMFAMYINSFRLQGGDYLVGYITDKYKSDFMKIYEKDIQYYLLKAL